ncbi:MAG TPA: hypothetical protein EYP65_08155 [Armatimonadetes bacterium]|nr:hypothetical protein [Armatimonadota bacterium]
MTGLLLFLQGVGILPPTYRSLFSDWVARKEGDVVNVVVIEGARATGLRREKDLGIARRALEARGFFSFLPRFSASHSMERKEEARRERATAVLMVVPARVVEVMPGGLLKIEGRREVRAGKERWTIMVKGLVRQSDIMFDNTVLSTRLVNAEISLTYAGPKRRKGLIGSILKFLF